MFRRPPRSTRTDTLFPYPTPFRSGDIAGLPGGCRPQWLVDGADAPVIVGMAPFGRARCPSDTVSLRSVRRFLRFVAGPATGVLMRVFSRSEEHTSELQSLMRTSYAVFCLKKKNTNIKSNNKK